jgi:hypothetical protein
MDGQLGIINGEDSHNPKYTDGYYSVVPCLLNKFLELHPPDSSTLLLEEAEGKTPLKVHYIKYKYKVFLLRYCLVSRSNRSCPLF